MLHDFFEKTHLKKASKLYFTLFRMAELIRILTRMKTSRSSKAFCSITDRQTDKIFTE